MKIGELAKRSGLTSHTIRYYERIGLLPRAERDRSNQRNYDAAILRWIEFLGRLKTTGMPIREMLVYARLRAEGAATTQQRRALLERHRVGVRRRLSELRRACSFSTKRSPATPAQARTNPIMSNDKDQTTNGLSAASARLPPSTAMPVKR